MPGPDSATRSRGAGGTDRRTAVLRTAMTTFARHGYLKTSMEQVARDAGISRQGLYFLFASKPVLFRDSAELTVREDLEAADDALAAVDEPLRERLLRAFDHWTGRYLGPLTRDVATVVEVNGEHVGPWVQAAPEKFARLVVAALRGETDRRSAERLGRTLISASVGIKHEVDTPAAYRSRLATAVDVILAAMPETTHPMRPA